MVCLVVTNNVLKLSPVGSDYWLHYVSPSVTCIRTTHGRFMCAEFKSAYGLVRMSSPVLWPRDHTQFMVSPYADVFRTPGTRGWEPAATFYQTLVTSYRCSRYAILCRYSNSHTEITTDIVILVFQLFICLLMFSLGHCVLTFIITNRINYM